MAPGTNSGTLEGSEKEEKDEDEGENGGGEDE